MPSDVGLTSRRSSCAIAWIRDLSVHLHVMNFYLLDISPNQTKFRMHVDLGAENG